MPRITSAYACHSYDQRSDAILIGADEPWEVRRHHRRFPRSAEPVARGLDHGLAKRAGVGDQDPVVFDASDLRVVEHDVQHRRSGTEYRPVKLLLTVAERALVDDPAPQAPCIVVRQQRVNGDDVIAVPLFVALALIARARLRPDAEIGADVWNGQCQHDRCVRKAGVQRAADLIENVFHTLDATAECGSVPYRHP